MMRSNTFRVLVAILSFAKVSSSSSSDDASDWCDSYDDDTVYNASTCESFDSESCVRYCVGDCSLFCNSDSPLNESTGGGYSCKSYSGAVCAMNVLSNLTESCSAWRAFTKEARVPQTNTTSLRKLGEIDRKLSGSTGCDDHVFCEFCANNYWCEELFSTLGIDIWGDFIGKLTTEGRGPAALFTLSDMDRLCNTYDMIVRLQDNVTALAGGTGEGGSFAESDQLMYQRSAASNAFALAGVAALVAGVALYRRRQHAAEYRAIATEDPEGA